MQNRLPIRLNRVVLNNLSWFLVSLVLAFFVWVMAVTQANPIDQQLFFNIPVHVELPDGVTVVNTPRTTVRVNVWAPRQVLDSLTQDDIVVRADLTQLEPGSSYVVTLQTDVARRAIADTQPTQIAYTLERIDERQKPVAINVTAEPPVDFARGNPQFSVNQALVSGAVSRVALVTGVIGKIDLSEQRNSVEEDVQLIPVDADGNPVDGVTVTPDTAHVSIEITPRDDIAEFPVQPNLLFETLPQGYMLSSLSYNPQSVFIGGSPAELARLQGTLRTEPIDLTGHTEDFEVNVAVALPEEDLLVLEGQTITVSVGITAQTSTTQFDNIPVEVIGVPDGQQVHLSPETVSVLVTGPQPVISQLKPDDIRVAVDLNGLTPGSHDVIPAVSLMQGQVSLNNVSVLPASIVVQIAPESTETPTSPAAETTPSPDETQEAP